MALAKTRETGAQLRRDFTIHRIAMVHRLGRLEIGETSVFIAISSPHRRAAFDACRFAIDTLKKTVPIWKKEHFKDEAAGVKGGAAIDRKSTRLNSSHQIISYAVFCLKKKSNAARQR